MTTSEITITAMPVSISVTAAPVLKRSTTSTASTHRGAEDEGDLHQAGQRLRLAMAEAMLGIRRHQGLADGDEIDDGGRGVERGIEQAR